MENINNAILNPADISDILPILPVIIGINDVIPIIKSIILELSLLDLKLFFLNKNVINNIIIIDIKIYKSRS